MHLSHSVNLVDSQLQPELGYMHPPFLKYATKVNLPTGAGLLVLVKDSTRKFALYIKTVCFTSHAYRYSIVYMCKY
jgi:hypothetical protein